MSTPGRVSYGWDAPGVMLGLLGAGLAGLLAALLVAGGVAGLALPVWTGWVIGALGAVPFGLGTAMLAYGLAGKRRMRERMLGAVSWTGDETVLDVGTGAGLLLVGAARRLTGGRAVGIDLWVAKDLSGNGIGRTRGNLVAEGVADRATVETGDALALPMGDASIDVVLSLLCIHNIEGAAGQRQACMEMARVLRPGGTIVVGDYLPTGGYAAAFREAGLEVRSNRACFGTALSLMWMVVAVRPLDDVAIGEVLA